MASAAEVSSFRAPMAGAAAAMALPPQMPVPAQIRANELRAKYGWELYAYHDGPPGAGRWIVGANLPTTDDTREYFRIQFDEAKL